MQNDLWNYCLNLYARPGVEQACLSLQDQGLDVCLLLCAAWLQERTVACSETRLEQLKACAGPWQREVVQPLRQLRIRWREAAADDEALAALRIRVKALELEAEGTVLRRLESATLGWSSAQSQDDCDWLRKMASSVGHPDCDALQTLRAAINRA
ncbi:TIGR02444 family protein [Pseudomonas versuta]|uniref:TIGR02444 family protein n=1 Tax=Pseudomonas versuta TaxID=1788301 RepID=UPI0037C6A9A6